MKPSFMKCLGIVGVGAMGQGIAQIAAVGGLTVGLYDARPGAALNAHESVSAKLSRLVEKGKLTPDAADQATQNLHVYESLEQLHGCQVVIEAIVENLEAKQTLFRQLSEMLDQDVILASNTSSLSITAIASVCRYPERIAGLHFFNPVPLMRLVEVIDGLCTSAQVSEHLHTLVSAMGHQPVRAKDSPGFIVNLAGRAFGTEALQILGEGVCAAASIDALLRDSAGFRMGPFELFDLVGLDVSLPVMESIYRQFYEEPRYRPHPLIRQMLAGGHLGRKTGQGFYRHDPENPQPRIQPAVPACTTMPPIWVGADDAIGRTRLLALLGQLGVEVETGERPSAQALCLLALLGDDATQAALRFAVDPTRVVGIDTLPELSQHRCLMLNPATREDMRNAAHALFARDGAEVTVIRDSVGFVVQRVLASIVNLGCDMAQQGIASVSDLDQAVTLGLGYPHGPLEWGDQLGARRLLLILERMNATTANPRYRPSPWLRRRALLDVSLRQPENLIPV